MAHTMTQNNYQIPLVYPILFQIFVNIKLKTMAKHTTKHLMVNKG